MSVRDLVSRVSITIVAMMVLIVGIGTIVSQRLIAAQARTETTATALRKHTQADMFHDMIRSLVFQAFYAGDTQDGDKMFSAGALNAEWQRYSQSLLDDLRTSKALPLSPELHAKLASLDAPFADYLASAKTIIASASSNPEMVRHKLSAFQAKFSALETAQEQISDALQAEFDNNRRDAAILGKIWNGLLVLGGIASVLSAYWLYMMLNRRLAMPMAELTAALANLTSGKTDMPINHDYRIAEVAELARGLSAFKDAAATTQHAQAQLLAVQSEAAATRQSADEARRRDMLAMADAFEAQVKSALHYVSTSSADLESTAHALSSGAEQTMQMSSIVAAASQQASINVSLVADAGDELYASIGEINRQMLTAREVAQTAAADVRDVKGTVTNLQAAVEEVGKIADMIAGIAAQTNLLSLNATIEAARAGEAGKGFGVVAREIKTLAEQTRQSTEEVAALVAQTASASAASASAIDDIVKSIGKLEAVSIAVASAIEQQSMASQEVAQRIGEAARGTEMVSTNIGEVSQAANQTGTAAVQTLNASKTLREQAIELSAQADSFLETLRAA